VTAHHVHPVDEPDLDLVVDARIEPQSWESAWLRCHGPDGEPRYIEADQAVPHGSHREGRAPDEVQPRPVQASEATIHGLLPIPPYGPRRFVGGGR
jgi:hypothetical protein